MKENLGRIAQAEGPKKQGGNNKSGKGGGDDEEGDQYKNQLSDAIVKEKPDVKWEDVAGLENAKKAIQEAVILPIQFPNFLLELLNHGKVFCCTDHLELVRLCWLKLALIRLIVPSLV